MLAQYVLAIISVSERTYDMNVKGAFYDDIPAIVNILSMQS